MQIHLTSRGTSPSGRGNAGCLTFVLLIVALAAGVAAGVRWHDPIVHHLGLHGPGMTDPSASPEGTPDTAAEGQLWTCSMHPQVIQKEPGACPICHMQLVPLRQDAQGGHESGGVRIDPAIVQNMGVRTAPLRRGPLRRDIRAVGILREAEPNIHEVSLRVDGWIEKLYADTDGEFIEKGAPLFDLYSPEIQQAVSELISLESRGGHAQALASVSARRLELWGLGPSQIEALARQTEAPRNVTFYSPTEGHVLDKNVFEGAGVMAGQRLFRIVDHHLLWLDVAVFEQDLPFIAERQPIRADLEALPGEPTSGEVVFIHPHVDPATRAATVRLAIHNPGMRLRPGMYATAYLDTILNEDALLAPREAIMDTGSRKVAFVAHGDGHFEPRDIETGATGSDGQVEVLAGLQDGDVVVTSGQFLLDTESRLREAVQKFLAEPSDGSGPDTRTIAAPDVSGEAAPVASHTSPETDALYNAYLQLSAILGEVPSEDTPLDVAPLLAASESLAGNGEHPAHEAGAAILELVRPMSGAPLEEQRTLFAPVSDAVINLSQTYAPSEAVATELYVLHCPMAPGSWLQSGPEVANPYYREEMKQCGTVVREVPARAGEWIMIARIIRIAMENRLLVVLLTTALAGMSIWSVYHLRLDAIPDLSDVQVIVMAEFPGQNPQVVDDQVTYPLASAMLSVPGSTAVRGFSMFEQSFVYVLFEDGTDIYWARSRVLEYLNFARDRLPQGVEPKLGPDATGVGWVYQYVLYPGYYAPDYPKGLWHDAESDVWYPAPETAPADRQKYLNRVRAFENPGECPLSGKPLVPANQDLAQLRSLQDWYLRYPLTAVDGVSEVAPIGGYVRQYQVILDPQKLQGYNLSLEMIRRAIERSNNDVGGSVVEWSENEYMVRSRGYLEGVQDLETVPVGLGNNGVPILLRDVATVQVGGEARRGVGEFNGIGEAAGGVIVARFGENAYKVIQDVKARLFALEDGLPPGVMIIPTYDRSALIARSIDTLRHTLIEEIVVVGLVCILFLLHARSELVAVFVVPSSVLVALLIMHLCGINANIMSLGGIAIAIGVVVDSAIVMVENGHKHLDHEEERIARGEAPRPRATLILEAAQEVGPQLFFSLLIITVSFVPVFVLGGEAGRLFRPLAFTKTAAMGAAAVLSITIIPVLMYYFISPRVLPRAWGWRRNLAITLVAMAGPSCLWWYLAPHFETLAPWRGFVAVAWAVFAGMLLVPQRIIHEQYSPISRVLQWVYNPVFHFAMRNRWLIVGLSVAAMVSTWYPASRLGTEFMPPLDEGDLLYMPTTDPSISVLKSRELLQQTDKLIRTFPEVITVHGKIGRADTATDPAPLSMIETVVQLNPDREAWRKRTIDRFHDGWPGWLRAPFLVFWPNERPITMEELKYGWTNADGSVHAGLNTVCSLPGLANAWPYPIENRINMLATGIKTPVGIKVLGPDLQVLGDLAELAANAVRGIPGTVSAYAERTLGGYYLDFEVDRVVAARYGLTVGDVQDVIQTAIGGMNITTTVEGLERYPLNLRYARELRDDLPALERLLVPAPGGAQIPLGQLARMQVTPGAPMIRSENAQRTAWVFVDVAGRDLGGYIAEARATVAREVPLPPGYTLVFSGQFEFWEKTIPRLTAATIGTLCIIVLLLYISSRSWFRVAVVMMAVPFSLVGAFWFMYLLDYNLSLAAVIGIIALAGLDAETGMVMLLYLDNSFQRFAGEGRMRSRDDLWHAVHDGAVMRIRPKAMTVASTFIGLVPLLWAEGTGADVMRRLAAPMIGGLLISFLIELILYPIIFYLYMSVTQRHRWTAERVDS